MPQNWFHLLCQTEVRLAQEKVLSEVIIFQQHKLGHYQNLIEKNDFIL